MVILLLLKPYNLIIGSSIHSRLGGTVHECFEYGDKMRVELATYSDERNAWFLNDGSGTWQGFICE